jgi:hypothetical protein
MASRDGGGAEVSCKVRTSHEPAESAAYTKRYMKRKTCFYAAVVFLLAGVAVCQQPLDGPKRSFQDALLDRMVGNWKLTGRIAGQSAEHSVTAEWVLNHQFLLIHEKSSMPAEDQVPYEAMIFVGYDNTSERYVVHWIDVFGGRIDETLGYGRRDGSSIRLTFEYPDGPFHTAFIWDEQSQSWRWEMDGKGSDGQWKEFARMALSRAKALPAGK